MTRDSRDNFELVYSEEFQTRKQAMDRERQVKKWSRAKKDALIKGDTGNLKKLARRKTLS